MACLYSEGRRANQETADEIIRRLEEHKNHIPSSILVRREYSHVLLEQYREYVEYQTGKDR